MTTELDRYFGARQEVDQAAGRKLEPGSLLLGGSTWNCEDRIRPALDALVAAWPQLTPRSPMLRRMHYAAARELVEELGEDEAPRFIEWARDKVSPTLTVKSCRSLLFLIGAWRSRATGPGWWTTPCPKCFEIHSPEGGCSE